MLKARTHSLPEDVSKLLHMNAAQVMRAVNNSIDSAVTNQLVARLRACQTPADFEEEIKRMNQELADSFIGKVPDEAIKQCALFTISCTMSRFITLAVFQDVTKFEKAVDQAKATNPSASITEVFRDFFEAESQSEPLRSLFEARPTFKTESAKILPLNFEVSQEEHVPKALKSETDFDKRMAYYYATMMTNSSARLFSHLLAGSDIADSLTPIRNFRNPGMAIMMARGQSPTVTCPVAHLDKDTRARLLRTMEKNA